MHCDMRTGSWRTSSPGREKRLVPGGRVQRLRGSNGGCLRATVPVALAGAQAVPKERWGGEGSRALKGNCRGKRGHWRTSRQLHDPSKTRATFHSTEHELQQDGQDTGGGALTTCGGFG